MWNTWWNNTAYLPQPYWRTCATAIASFFSSCCIKTSLNLPACKLVPCFWSEPKILFYKTMKYCYPIWDICILIPHLFYNLRLLQYPDSIGLLASASHYYGNGREPSGRCTEAKVTVHMSLMWLGFRLIDWTVGEGLGIDSFSQTIYG